MSSLAVTSKTTAALSLGFKTALNQLEETLRKLVILKLCSIHLVNDAQSDLVIASTKGQEKLGH